jgi:hypothetical protein
MPGIQETDGYLDVENATLRSIKFEATSNISIANTSPQHAFSVGSNLFVSVTSPDVINIRGNVVTDGIKVGTSDLVVPLTGNVGIGKTDPSSALDVAGNIALTGGVITNTSGTAKKTYSYTGTFPTTTTDAQATLDIVFAPEIFSAKITAHLIEDATDISVLSLDVGGGSKTGTPVMFKGPHTIFSATNKNPWSPTIATAATATDMTISIKPTTTIQTGGDPANYNIFVEYTSSATGGKLKQLNDHQSSPVTVLFDY